MEIDNGFRKYLVEAIGQENASVAFSAFNEPASVSVRLNPSKLDSAGHFGCAAHHVAWNPYGYILDERPVFTLDPLLHAGAYYVQDSSSMFVGEVFRRILPDMVPQGRPVRVLDLCAAPGGKTTDLAASLREFCGDGFVLVSNEVMKARANVLADNVALWGDGNVVVTNADPSAFSGLKGCFDVIVADLPCSGEGMFRKDVRAMEQWSEDNVALCCARQRRIIADVWDALADGGVLIYSTCTFNKYENDSNIEWIIGNLSAESLNVEIHYDGVLKTGYGFSLVPGLVKGEGQYCAAVVKTGDDSPVSNGKKTFPGKSGKPSKSKDYPEFKSLFARPVELRQKGELIVALPECIVSEIDTVTDKVRPIRVGCAVGEIKGKSLVPSADLALSNMLTEYAFPSAGLDLKTARAFLHRDSIVLDNFPKGIVMVCYCGHPLGFVKNLGNRCNNLHPQDRRIRMDI